ncbi:MAG: uroporphyrinogen decarboxylase family protein [Armatimonadota bacterium]|nr:uroporphyrinogen decarboxylase family protein [Armatimonadota bacterium]MDR7423577.1 uroporphyrinogen decarboxylase family protein [Armatimonadota bacterium]MDR7454587.1 uroporphyrinogen decarboxylase family protein [Armatimonadota bacterium]MDR7456026.1 uroporphyrinogen decarboxylase family protein [Armatimonadota bacterium]MDR7495937.1 uroporphyrinogen decarboxylase family protein [Armatimonadota bacterium]
MTKRERVYAAIDGRPVDRPPVALWRHFPQEDQRAEPLAAAHVAFFRAYDWDFLKVTSASGFYGDDWGLRSTYRPNREGTRHYTDRPIKRDTDWPKLKRIDVTAGAHGRELRTLRLIRKELPEEIVLATVFSPLSIARTLAGETALLRYLRDSVDEMHEGLDIITEATAKFAEECLAAGADGLFFATQCASTAYMTIEEYEEFARPYDLRVLDAARHAEIIMLHIHGERIMFEQLTDYPVQIINWHDRRTTPTLKEARAQFSGTLAGGIDAMDTIGKGTPEQVTAEVRDAIAQTGGTRFIATAGCVIPIDAPEANLRAVRQAVGA